MAFAGTVVGVAVKSEYCGLLGGECCKRLKALYFAALS